MEVFITKANAERIIDQIDLNQINIQQFKNEMKFKWFNNLELKKLNALYLFFSDQDLFLSKYKKHCIRENDGKFVFKGSAPAFHKNSTCERLNSDFKNIFVPNEINSLQRRKEYIQWCEEQKELFYKYPDQFRLRLKYKFKLSIDPFVRYDNSGTDSFDNCSPEELETLIQNKILEAEKFICSSVQHQDVISSLGLHSFNYKNPDKLDMKRLKNPLNKKLVIEILEKFECNYKMPLIKLFKNYYRIKNNKVLKFGNDILSELGFHPCTSCCSMSIHEFYAA